jgi:pimeloyl-ACP methyl ester carboxylesterase
MESDMRDFGTAVLVRDVCCRRDAARLEQMRADLIKAELLGTWFAPLRADRLLVTDQRSPALVHPLTDRLAELLPHAEGIEVQGASHLTHEENASAFNAAVQSFLARHRRAT